MDGNRRWAKKKCQEPIHGHRLGFDKMKEALRWCLELGVRVVTVYAFSIDNFKRPQDEVDSLMELSKEKFDEMCSKGVGIIDRFGVRIQVLGNLSFVRQDVVASLRRAVEASSHCSQLTLNICFSYSSQQEWSDAASLLTEHELANNQMNGVARVSSLLYTGDQVEDSASISSRPLCVQGPGGCLRAGLSDGGGDPDLLVRTSGETRLSDFLLWQSCRHTVVAFLPSLWPDFSFWQWGRTILHFQQQKSAAISEVQSSLRSSDPCRLFSLATPVTLCSMLSSHACRSDSQSYA